MELTEIKGIGEARKKSFKENGIFSCEDLINYFPYKYYDFTKTEPFAEDGNVRLIKAQIIDNPNLICARGNLSFVSCKAVDEIGHKFTAVWFNQTYVKAQLYIGLNLFLYGKNSPKKKNTFNVTMMKFEEKMSNVSFLPVYHSIEKIGQATISDSINKSLQMIDISTLINDNLLLKYNLLNLKQAYNFIHNPESKEQIEQARDRIEIEKLLPILLSNEQNKALGKDKRIYNYKNIIKIKQEFLNLLPYNLTSDQTHAIDDIIHDFESGYSLNRLLEGDVGSGKTIVAMFGAYLAAKNGFQSAIIAPTEILSKQHFETATKLFFGQNINIRLLTSSTTALERKIILNEIQSGIVQIVIGTHSLLSNEICFNNLSYVVIDEQHRFGVEQRAQIKQKGNNPDVLVMSATPIPRTIGLVVYGSLDISTLLSRPKAANIVTNIVIKSKQLDMWNYIKGKLDNGSKAYVVCSKIDEENENDSVIKYSAKNMYDYLCLIFDKSQVGLIHGKLKKDTQDKVIENFRLGKIKILVTTTIVEVGVDIPDSDIMVIATPERFGLATLHQLRGRIGRNGAEAHCFCLADNLNENSVERITYFKNHSNGFDIAEFDLKTRGAGTIFGLNQHGASDDVLSNFSNETYNIAKQIFEEIKTDKIVFNNLKTAEASLMLNKTNQNIVLN